jgi:hypothetical protein
MQTVSILESSLTVSGKHISIIEFGNAPLLVGDVLRSLDGLEWRILKVESVRISKERIGNELFLKLTNNAAGFFEIDPIGHCTKLPAGQLVHVIRHGS